MTNDRDSVIKEVDALILEYHTEQLPLQRLIEVRRHIATFSWFLSGFVKDTHGKAALGYAKRKFEIANHIVSARNIDAKAPLAFLEQAALKTVAVMETQKQEIDAEGEREQLKERIRAIGNVLQSLAQEIAELRQEKSSQHFANQGA